MVVGRPEVCVFTGSWGQGISRGAGLLGVPNPGEDAAPTPVPGYSLGGLFKASVFYLTVVLPRSVSTACAL